MSGGAAGKSGLARDLTFPNSGVTTPRLVYGTAWKKNRTADLVYAALRAGFRGVDTAAQPRHYNEQLVGDGIRRAVAEGIVQREDLFIQTKFTLPDGQDHDDMPYSLDSSLEEQVHASVASSFQNLAVPSTSSSSSSPVPIIDSLVLHVPPSTKSDLLTIWRTLSTYVPHKIRQLGIANLPSASIIDLLIPAVGHQTHLMPPCVIQNRFYPDTDYDVDLRAYCAGKGILYQSFWTLTANKTALVTGPGPNGPVLRLAAAVDVSPFVALYALVLGLGDGQTMTVLNGTTSEAHMVEDLEGVEKVGRFAEEDGEGKGVWEDCLRDFKGLLGEEELY